MSKQLIKNTIVLTVITLIAGLLLGFVYEITKDPIARQESQKKQNACKNVFSEAVSFDTAHTTNTDDAEKILASDFASCTIDECIKALDSSNTCIGYVLSVTTSEGYGGDISLMMGVKLDGSLNGIDILKINETAGLGMKAKDTEFKNQFQNKKYADFKVVKGEKSSDSQIQAISSATITSKAVTNAVNAGLTYFRISILKGVADHE